MNRAGKERKGNVNHAATINGNANPRQPPPRSGLVQLKQSASRGTEQGVVAESVSPAKAMGAEERCALATRVLAGTESISQAARERRVSRKFVARQKVKAQHALAEAFAPPAEGAEEVLFHLPVTKSRIEQVTLGLGLTCHSSQRGIVQFFADHFDYHLSLGRVHNILSGAVAQARVHNAEVDLSRVDVAVLDEIFQARAPILVGADAASTYCFLLSCEEHRDADTWGIRLLEQADRGLAPRAAIADFGSGLRAGLAQALPEVPCGGDVFHALMDLQAGVRTLENRAYRAIEQRDRAERQRRKPTGKNRFSTRNSLGRLLFVAQQREREAINLASDVRTLVDWLHFDILDVAGPPLEERRALYDFILSELRPRLEDAGDTLKPILSLLDKHRDDLLVFAEQLDQQLHDLARQLEVDPTLLRDLLAQQAGNPHQPDYWQREAQLHRRAGGRLHQLRHAVERLRRRTVRASSVVENLNSRLRSYFFLRRHLGPDYLTLLQFYLNHRRFPRSQRTERTGKSPRQLLTGQDHPHWLEMLGYQRFERN